MNQLAVKGRGFLLFLLAVVLAFPIGADEGRSSASTSWTSQILANIRDSEYAFSVDGDSRTAPNRAHQLRSFVSAEGLRVVPRDGSGRWELTLTLAELARGDWSARPRGRVVPGATPHRVEIVGGRVAQWFVNRPEGLEQGFTLDARPGRADNGPFRLEIAVGGTLEPTSDPDSGRIAFASPDGSVGLDYAGLRAWDALGRDLPARMTLSERTIRIEVDDAEAVYPVVVDPTITNPDWSFEGNQESAGMGISVASAGDVNGDGFGDVVVGAAEFDNGQLDEGRVYVFHGSASGLPLTPAFIAESNQIRAAFGRAVSSAGRVNDDPYDDVVVGADDFDDGVDLEEGWVFVYHGSSTGLDLNGTRPEGTPGNADWMAQGNQSSGGFGIDVCSANVNGDAYDDLIVGADEYSNGQTDEGGIFVYYGSASGLDLGGTRLLGDPTNADWSAESNIVEADYGLAVANAGDVNNDGFEDIIVGAPELQNNFDKEGRAYLYLGGAAGPRVGSCSETSVLCDLDSECLGGPTDLCVEIWTFDGARDLALLGASVAGAGDVNSDGFDDVIVGSPDFSNGQSFEGSAFLFLGNSSGLLGSTPSWFGELDQTRSKYGIAVAGAGDVNQDGFDDVIVGAERYDNGELDEGSAFLYYGSATGLPTSPSIRFEIDQEGARMGIAVNGAGDVNDDGFDDLLVGADRFTKVQVGMEDEEGAAFAYYGCPDTDTDGACQNVDNCPTKSNPDQADADGDGTGDECDPCQDIDDDLVCDAPRVFVEWAGPGEQVLVTEGTTMRYLANRTDPELGLSWTTLFFPDGSWSIGTYGVGYESAGGATQLLSTVVDDGSCSGMANCPASIYTRADFLISDVTEVESLFLGVDYDDGFVAWINGVEVFRSAEMPSTDPEWNTPSVSHESSNASDPDYGTLLDISQIGISLLENGVNTLAIGVWNTGQSSSDLVLVPRLSINRPESGAMRYLANASDPGIGFSWVMPTFNDNAWNEGSFGVGYETGAGADSLINTEVPSETVSVYARADFNLVPETVQSVFLGADYDDAYVAWVNGVEVARSPEIPPGPLSWDLDPAAHESSNGAMPNYGTLLDITAQTMAFLNDGSNTLAVAVWRNSTQTDDMVLVPRLSVNETDLDNCLGVPNTDQADTDGDGEGDACDADIDNDTRPNAMDNCPFVANPGQEDFDGDGLGDVCDTCPDDANNDVDGDGICEGTGFMPPKSGDGDNCPMTANTDQKDTDGDGLGDVCDPDIDNDMIPNGSDNCPLIPNNDQTNLDNDIRGAACDCEDEDEQVWEAPTAVDTLRFAKDDVCADFLCTESGSPCAADAQCLSDVCEDLACSMSLGTCDSNNDCDQDECQNFNCTVGLNACASDTECTADVCANMTCSSGGNMCASDTECTADFCTNKTCTETFGACTTSAECTGGPTDLCVGMCSIGANACLSDAACTLDVCQGTCSAGANPCSGAADCTADFCEGACSIGGNDCIDDTVCTAPQQDVCEGSCSIGGNTCTDDGSCTAPQTDVCRGECAIGGNVCVDDVPCVLPPAQTLVWDPPSNLGAIGVAYDTLRSPVESSFAGATCLDTNGADLLTEDGTTPSVGATLFYLVRVENNCPASALGPDSNNQPRTAATCP